MALVKYTSPWGTWEASAWRWSNRPSASPLPHPVPPMGWGGLLVSPGDLYGAAGAGHVRAAAVAPLDRLQLVARRLGVK